MQRTTLLDSGAGEVCITDGDEDSVRLAEANVRENLPWARHGTRTRGCDTQETGGAAVEELRVSSVPHVCNARDGVDGDSTQRPSRGAGLAGDAGGDRSERDRHDREAETGRASAPVVTVRRLLWGDRADMEAAGGGPWDVILGSDIAALPYASAHDDLVQTIVSLAERGQTTAEPSSHGVVVLLAYKRRHASEGAFFEALERYVGSGVELGESELHPDFKSAGITLRMYRRPALRAGTRKGGDV